MYEVTHLTINNKMLATNKKACYNSNQPQIYPTVQAEDEGHPEEDFPDPASKNPPIHTIFGFEVGA